MAAPGALELAHLVRATDDGPTGLGPDCLPHNLIRNSPEAESPEDCEL